MMQPVLSRLGQLKKYLTAEVVIFLYYVSTTISQLVTLNLMIFKECWPDAPPAEFEAVCPNEEAAQEAVSKISIWKPLLHFLVPAIAVAFAGPWSDKYGRRRPLLLAPLSGQMISAGCLAIGSVFWTQVTPVHLAIMETVPTALTGGRAVLGAGVMSYLMDITPMEERTTRLNVLVAFIFVGTPVGSLLTGVSNRWLGFMGTYILCGAVDLMGLLFAALRLPEPPNLEPSGSGSLKSVLSLLRQPRLAVLAVVTLFVGGPIVGEYSVKFLYMRYMFQWNEMQYSIYAAYKMVLISAGTVLTVTVLCKKLKMNDSMIGILSCSTKIVASLLYLLVTSSWQMYVVPFAELLHGAVMAVHKSIGSKIVGTNKVGKLNALYCIAEAIVPLGIVPLYYAIYEYTFTYFAAAFFLASAVLTAPALLMFIWFYVEHRRELSKGRPDESVLDRTGTDDSEAQSPRSNAGVVQDEEVSEAQLAEWSPSPGGSGTRAEVVHADVEPVADKGSSVGVMLAEPEAGPSGEGASGSASGSVADTSSAPRSTYGSLADVSLAPRSPYGSLADVSLAPRSVYGSVAQISLAPSSVYGSAVDVAAAPSPVPGSTPDISAAPSPVPGRIPDVSAAPSLVLLSAPDGSEELTSSHSDTSTDTIIAVDQDETQDTNANEDA